MKMLGVDFGLRRVGLSACDESQILAYPLGAVKTSSMRMTIDLVASKAQELMTEEIVVGLPLNLDGTEGEQSGRVRAFAKVLEKVTKKKVRLFDERLSTVTADEWLRDSEIKDKKKRDGLIDSASAVVILQGYIDSVKQSK